MNIDQAHLKQWYDTEAARNDQVQMYRVPWAQKRRETIHSLLEPLVKGKTVLDVGCGIGQYSQWMVANGAQKVTGFDIAPTNIAGARLAADLQGFPTDKLSFIEMSWDDLDVTSWWLERLTYARYDLVLATEVFEHAIDPAQLARALGTAATRMVASAPLEPEVPSDPWQVQGHLHVFTQVTFENLLTNAGWEIEKSFSDGIYVYVVTR